MCVARAKVFSLFLQERKKKCIRKNLLSYFSFTQFKCQSLYYFVSDVELYIYIVTMIHFLWIKCLICVSVRHRAAVFFEVRYILVENNLHLFVGWEFCSGQNIIVMCVNIYLFYWLAQYSFAVLLLLGLIVYSIKGLAS